MSPSAARPASARPAKLGGGRQRGGASFPLSVRRRATGREQQHRAGQQTRDGEARIDGSIIGIALGHASSDTA